MGYNDNHTIFSGSPWSSKVRRAITIARGGSRSPGQFSRSGIKLESDDTATGCKIRHRWLIYDSDSTPKNSMQVQLGIDKDESRGELGAADHEYNTWDLFGNHEANENRTSERDYSGSTTHG